MDEKYALIEKELAQLLEPYYQWCIDNHGAFHRTTDDGDSYYNDYAPNWTQESLHALLLISQYHINLEWSNSSVSATIEAENNATEEFSDHADQDTALRFALVQVVIQKLKSGKKPNSY
jgi:hypothetical protein